MVRNWGRYRPVNTDELQEKMDRFSESSEAYSTKWLKKKLKDRYSDHFFA